MCQKVLLLLIILIASPLFATVPRVSFPDWAKVSLSIQSWKPQQNELIIKLELTPLIDITEINSQLFLTGDMKLAEPSKHACIQLNSNKTKTFNYKIIIKPERSGWLELDLKAKPSIEQLKSLIEAQYPNNPLTKEILISELNTIDSPIYIGRGFPLFTRKDIALLSTKELAFEAKLEKNNQLFYLWLPPQNTASGLTSETFSLYLKAINSANLNLAIKTADLLLQRIQNSKHLKINQEFEIPQQIATQIISASRETLNAIINNDTSSLEEMINSDNFKLVEHYLSFNIAAIYKLNDDFNNAQIWLLKALEYPYSDKVLAQDSFWPLAQQMLSNK